MATNQDRAISIAQHRRDAPHCLSLWEILIWTYRDQMAHRYLRKPVDWFLWAIETSAQLDDMPRPMVHQDAAAIHASVMTLDQHSAELIVYFAAEALIPEAPVAIPRPYPTDVDRDRGRDDNERWAWATIRGKRVDYMVRVADRVTEVEPILEKVGRKTYRVVGHDTVTRPVEYCPLTWQPDPAYVLAQATIHNEWLRAMRGLYAHAHEIRLTDRVIEGLGIDAGLASTEQPVMSDARAEELDAEYRHGNVRVKVSTKALKQYDEQIVCRRRAWTNTDVSSK
jgi:hypothetical protein